MYIANELSRTSGVNPLGGGGEGGGNGMPG